MRFLNAKVTVVLLGFSVLTPLCADPLNVEILSETLLSAASNHYSFGFPVCSSIGTNYASCGDPKGPPSPSDPALATAYIQYGYPCLTSGDCYVHADAAAAFTMNFYSEGDAYASVTENLVVTGGIGTGYIGLLVAGGGANFLGGVSLEVNGKNINIYGAGADVAAYAEFPYGQPFSITLSASAESDNEGNGPYPGYATNGIAQVAFLPGPPPSGECSISIGRLDCGPTLDAAYKVDFAPEPSTVFLAATPLVFMMKRRFPLRSQRLPFTQRRAAN